MAIAVSAVEKGANTRKLAIHAPDTPTSANTKGKTQQLEAKVAAKAANATAQVLWARG